MGRVAAMSVLPDETAGTESAAMLGLSLSRARHAHTEQPESALAEAMRCHEIARSTGDTAIAARALCLQGFVSLHRGNLHSAIALGVAAGEGAEASPDLEAQAEVATLKALLSFFSGSYVEAISQARSAVELADRHAGRHLRLFVRRMTCPVFGNLGTQDLRADLELTLSLAADDPRESALSRNDIATWLAAQGERQAAQQELGRAFAVLADLPNTSFTRAVLHITRAELRLADDDPRGALIDSRRGLELLAGDYNPNPYLLGAAIHTEVQGLLALGDLDQAQQLGEDTLARLGDHVPQTRSMILSVLAEALRQAGRLDQAYETLSRAAQLEREAFRELTALQSGLERATLETVAARRRGDNLMAKNRELADAHAELARRSLELEQLQEQLRDQAERDWLTGLHNRRFLARQFDLFDTVQAAGPISIAILDIDNFKAINDRFGHGVGDQVLVEVARALDALRASDDITVRSGGEEFVAVMPDTDEPAAVGRCERIRARILEHPWSEIAHGLSVSVSIGVGCTDVGSSLRGIMNEADSRLYTAKRGGRNRVIAGGLQ